MIREQKKEIRAYMRALKKEKGKAKLLEMSKAVSNLLLLDNNFKKANTVMLYAALWDEVNIDAVLQYALGDGKRVIYPTVVGDDIVPVEILKNTMWEKGEYGILEPQAEAYHGDIDLIVVPGVAFDKFGGRLGRGKGYYDRFLCKYPNAYTVGICFEFQLVDSIPIESFDLRIASLICG